MFSSRDQPQDRGVRSSQLRMGPTVIGRSESQRCESVGATDKESTGNIDLLKVIKSDFSTHLAKTHRDKKKVVEYKTKETGSLHQAVTMLFSDRNGVHSRHDAIHSFSGELKKQCIASKDRCESCEQDAVSKKRAARRKAFAA